MDKHGSEMHKMYLGQLEDQMSSVQLKFNKKDFESLRARISLQDHTLDFTSLKNCFQNDSLNKDL